MKREQAESCEECAYHHKDEYLPEGWYCGNYRKWDCSKTALYKDHSRKKKEKNMMGKVTKDTIVIGR